MSSTLSIRMQGNEARASLYASIHVAYIALAVLIQSQQSFERPYPQYHFRQDERISKLFDVYLEMSQ